MDTEHSHKTTHDEVNVQVPKVDIFQVLQTTNKIINEKYERCFKFREEQDDVRPTLAYTQNTPKEELVLEHVI